MLLQENMRNSALCIGHLFGFSCASPRMGNDFAKFKGITPGQAISRAQFDEMWYVRREGPAHRGRLQPRDIDLGPWLTPQTAAILVAQRLSVS
jgi:hypothetical protein